MLAQSYSAVGFALVVVDAIDESAARFYRRFGFFPLVDGGERPFMTTKNLRASLDGF